ncbi:phosphatidate cytidylyltransferase [Alkalilimnicola sp. S0819]|uniref:phosphatidate cytidylyltransferase n=1 Tax=Alkalilimnicola sp. S0819 TaxID=2613922 RepID=UPI001261E547|nr:phosphatidate cytidylyltransferase [Alkalilimnicola sp. S0819]KAB7627921.1 phosphatidate cytidylyltransferase [Alkalilimnicola sp. S0819]MPQ15557.1 phosphatidate cytidylyltransferase [Alkalilimnicola sp. S0819]
MLKARLITALTLAPLFLWAVLFWSSNALSVFFAAIMLLAGWEWSRLIPGLSARLPQALFLLLLIVLMVLAHRYLATTAQPWPPLLPAALGWVLVLPWMHSFSAGRGAALGPVAGALVGVLVLLPPWLALIWLHLMGGWYWLFLLLLLITSADIGAYFAGRRFGRRKLAPRVSPGKTWEGLLGGLVLALVAMSIAHGLFGRGELNYAVLLPVGLVTVLFSVVGDLFESMIKRQRGVKDSSALLPGHGGVLDRVDSITAAAPWFALGLMWGQAVF